MRYLLYILLLINVKASAQTEPLSISIDSATTCKQYKHLIIVQSTYTNNTADTLFLPKEKTEIAAFAYSTSRDMDRTHSKDNVIIIDSTRNRLISTYSYIDYKKPFTAPELLECLGPVFVANQKVKTRKIAGRDCFIFPPRTTIHLHTTIKTLPEDDIAFKNFTDDDRTSAHINLKYHLVYYRNGIALAEADITPAIPQQLPDIIRKQMNWR